MIKYNFLLYHQDLEDFLKRLQELGVVDVESYAVELDENTKNLLELSTRFDTAYKALKAIKITDEAEPFEGSPDLALKIYETIKQERALLDIQIKKIEKDIDDALPWGSFNPFDLERLQNVGITPRFYVAAERMFRDEWAEHYTFCEMNRINGKVYFALLQENGTDWDFELQEVKLPKTPYADLLEDLKELNATDAKYQNTLAGLALSAEILETERKRLIELVNFNAAGLSAKEGAEGKLKILTAWVPEEQNKALLKFLDSESVIFLSEKNPDNEIPPVLLKNSKFAKLFEPITKLYSLPEYAELDPTPLFAPFFMLFFGFCLGDGGYGIFLFVVASLLKLKIKNPNFRPYLSLIQWLGGAAVLFGFITGTIFGLKINAMDLISKAETYFGLPESYGLLALSLILGFIQIIFGMCVKVANLVIQQGWKYALAQIGWIIIILGGGIYLAFGKQFSTIQQYALLGVIGVAALVALFYNTPGKNPFLNLGIGLWNTYGTASGLLGDLLSYIRLFALGMTGGILGSVFNKLAVEMSGDIPVVSTIIMILILLFGHSLNIMLNALGAFVHPMRLTFVEFYRNAGFTGGGRPFKAFKKETDSQ